ncbi:MAG: nucleotide exchange factor GrpE [Verrucomicrobiota bacterium]
MTDTKSTLPVWPFLVADVLFLGLAYRIDSLAHRPLLWWEGLLVVACGAAAAGSFMLPFLRRHNNEEALNQAQLLAQATSQIQNLDHLAALVTGATNQWREYQQEATQTALTAKGVAETMAAEAKAFTEFIQRANDMEKAHLRLEADKLRRAETEWLHIVVHILDHVFLLFQAARRSSQPGLADQIGMFQNSCRDAARRVGLVPTTVEPGASFDPKLHQVPDSVTPGENAIIADMLATGFTFQGQLIRRPLVALQDGPAPSGEAAAVAPEAEA